MTHLDRKQIRELSALRDQLQEIMRRLERPWLGDLRLALQQVQEQLREATDRLEGILTDLLVGRELERRAEMIHHVLADLERAGVKVTSWQVAGAFEKINFGWEKDLDIEIVVPDGGKERLEEEVLPRLLQGWEGKVKVVAYELSQLKCGLRQPRGCDFCFGGGMTTL